MFLNVWVCENVCADDYVWLCEYDLCLRMNMYMNACDWVNVFWVCSCECDYVSVWRWIVCEGKSVWLCKWVYVVCLRVLWLCVSVGKSIWLCECIGWCGTECVFVLMWGVFMCGYKHVGCISVYRCVGECESECMTCGGWVCVYGMWCLQGRKQKWLDLTASSVLPSHCWPRFNPSTPICSPELTRNDPCAQT